MAYNISRKKVKDTEPYQHQSSGKAYAVEGEDAKKIREDLEQNTGTEHYYKVSIFSDLKATDGVINFQEKTRSYWLGDIVASVQNEKAIKQNNNFIIWKVEKYKDNTGKVTAWNDTAYAKGSKLLYKQDIPYTDIPLNNYEFYQEGDVLLLKSER